MKTQQTADPLDTQMPMCASGMRLGCLPSEVGSIPVMGAKTMQDRERYTALVAPAYTHAGVGELVHQPTVNRPLSSIGGSSPSTRTARSLTFDEYFTSLSFDSGLVAQSVEQGVEASRVGGSIPSQATMKKVSAIGTTPRNTNWLNTRECCFAGWLN